MLLNNSYTCPELTRDITIHTAVQTPAISHLLRLHTLGVEAEDGDPHFPLTFEPAPALLPRSLQRLVVRGGLRGIHVSMPALAPSATVQLSSREQIALTGAPGHLVGCRLELSAASVMIVYKERSQESRPSIIWADLAEHLIRWLKLCGPVSILLRPCDSNLTYQDERFHVETDTPWMHDEHPYEQHADEDGSSELLRERQSRCAAQSLCCEHQREDDGSVYTIRRA